MLGATRRLSQKGAVVWRPVQCGISPRFRTVAGVRSVTGAAGSSHSSERSELTVFYDGGCPLCRREIGHYQRLNARHSAGIAFTDITQPSGEAQLVANGVDKASAMKLLHAMTASGEKKVAVDAFDEIWQRLPGWKLAALSLQVPPVRWLAASAYNAFAERRWRIRTEAKPSAACSINDRPGTN